MKDTLIIFQCCKSKKSVELYPNESFELDEKIPMTIEILENGVRRFIENEIIDDSTVPVSALSLYQGHFYRVPGLKSRIVNEIKYGPYQFLIMSAGYGFVHPFQRIHNYEARMTGKISKCWLRAGLPSVLEEFIKTDGYKKVYGLFSKSADYKKIFENVNWSKLIDLEEAGYFYLEGIRGASKVLKLQASFLVKMINEGFESKCDKFDNARISFIQKI